MRRFSNAASRCIHELPIRYQSTSSFANVFFDAARLPRKTFANELDRGLMMVSAFLRLPVEVKLLVLLHQAAEGKSLARIESRLQYRGFHTKRSIRIHRRNSLLLRTTLALRSASTFKFFLLEISVFNDNQKNT